MIKKQKQQGAALLTAILITAVVAILASNIILNQHQWIAQTGLADRQNKFNLVADRVSDWAHMAATIRSQTKNASQLPKWPAFNKSMQGINVKAQLVDANTLYNLNWLVDPKMDVSFARLILAVQPDIEPRKAFNMAQSVTATMQIAQGMAPSNQKQAKGPDAIVGVPVMGPLLSVLQLRTIKGFNAKLVAKLRPYVSVLPVKAGINITTGNKKVIKALLKPTQNEATQWMAYLSCRQAFAGQHPNATAWAACLQQNDGSDFLTDFAATSPVISGSSNPQQINPPGQNNQDNSDDQSDTKNIAVYRSNYAALSSVMVQTDLSSAIQAIYWLPNQVVNGQQNQDSQVDGGPQQNHPRVTLVSYWRS